MKKKETTEADIRRIKKISYIILAVVELCAVLIFSWVIYHAYWADFTPEKWQARPDRRASMVEDLLEEHPLEGLTEAEVIALLGENDNDRGYFAEEDRLVYWLGDRRTGIDSEWLLVDLENGAVTSCQWTTD